MDEYISTERELWNSAKIFSITHVAEPLVTCRKLITICLFGVEEVGQEYRLPKSILNQNKVIAINRLLQELKQIVDDNINFMKKDNVKNLLAIKDKLDNVEKYIDGISGIVENTQTKQSSIEIYDEHYNNTLIELRQINSDIKKYLGDLIFPAGDDLDFEKIKRDIIEAG